MKYFCTVHNKSYENYCRICVFDKDKQASKLTKLQEKYEDLKLEYDALERVYRMNRDAINDFKEKCRAYEEAIETLLEEAETVRSLDDFAGISLPQLDKAMQMASNVLEKFKESK